MIWADGKATNKSHTQTSYKKGVIRCRITPRDGVLVFRLSGSFYAADVAKEIELRIGNKDGVRFISFCKCRIEIKPGVTPEDVLCAYNRTRKTPAFPYTKIISPD